MKKGIAIFFLGIFLLTNSELHQFMKIPLLIQHYHKHKQENPGISFLGFMAMHYQGRLVIDEDFAQDQQLPFQKADCADLFNTVIEIPQALPVMVHPVKLIPVSFRLFNSQNYSFYSLREIFQPPRHC